jgi:hypothetical protein
MKVWKASGGLGAFHLRAFLLRLPLLFTIGKVFGEIVAIYLCLYLV